jgi:hypothetical protein
MLEGFCLSTALSYFCCFLTWEGVSDLGGVVECDFVTEEKPEGRCPWVKLEAPRVVTQPYPSLANKG